MPQKTPLPYAFAKREEFLKLPLDRRTKHLWQAHDFCERQLGQKRFADDELRRNIGVLRRMMLQVAKHVAKQLREEGAWKDPADGRWPRNYKGKDPEHWYDSGAFPPQFLALPRDPDGWREVLAKDPDALFEEMVAWTETPAGHAGVADAELQKLLVERDASTLRAEKADGAEKPQPAAAKNGELS